MKYVWVMTGSTESGDDIGPYVWVAEPTQEDIDAVLMRDMPEEVEAECCDSVSVDKVLVGG